MQVQLQLRDGINLVGITTEIPAEIPTDIPTEILTQIPTEVPSDSNRPKQLEPWSENGWNRTSVLHASSAATEGWNQFSGNHH